MKGYTNINDIYANKPYRRPVNQYESYFSMTNKVHDTNVMLLMFLDLRSRDSFTRNIWSHEKVDPYLKKVNILLR